MAVILKAKYGAIIHKPRDITLTQQHKDDPDTKARFEAAARAAFYVVSG